MHPTSHPPLPHLSTNHQGLPKDEKGNMGRVPVPIPVELSEDLVGSLTPGDVATVVGVVKVQTGEAAGAPRLVLELDCKRCPGLHCTVQPYQGAVGAALAPPANYSACRLPS